MIAPSRFPPPMLVLAGALLLCTGCAHDLSDSSTSPVGTEPSVEEWQQQVLAMHEAAEAEADRTNPIREDLTAAWFPMPEWPEGTLPPIEDDGVVPTPPLPVGSDTAWEPPADYEVCRTGVDPEPEPVAREPIAMEPPGVGRPEPGPPIDLDTPYDGPAEDLNPDPEWAAAVIEEIDQRLAVLERAEAGARGWDDEERYAQKLALWAEVEAEDEAE